MNRDLGPPDWGKGRAPHHQDPQPHLHGQQAITKTASHHQPSAAGRHIGRYATAFRHGFGCGFRDALRLAARRLGPETWHTLAQLEDEYSIWWAGDD
jgi:hypothetical protein